MRNNPNKNCPDCNKPLLKPWRDERCRPCSYKAKKISPEIRFWKYVNKTDSCWLWTGAKHNFGYGCFDKKYAHRFSYELHIGKIPTGLFVCHHCDIRNCVFPSHLFIGTNNDNMQDKIRKGRQSVGEELHHNIFTENQIREIRSLYIPKKYGFVRLAKRFGTDSSNIAAIIHRKTWKHI